VGKCGKVTLLLGGTFPSGGGNPRSLRISTDAAFSIKPFITSFLPTNLTEDPNFLKSKAVACLEASYRCWI
jgi:hypothetical protein